MSLERQQGAGRLPSFRVYIQRLPNSINQSVLLRLTSRRRRWYKFWHHFQAPLHKQPPVFQTHACTPLLPRVLQLHRYEVHIFQKARRSVPVIFFCVFCFFSSWGREGNIWQKERKESYVFKEKKKKRILTLVIPFLCVTLDPFFPFGFPPRERLLLRYAPVIGLLPGRLVSKECACASNFFLPSVDSLGKISISFIHISRVGQHFTKRTCLPVIIYKLT